MNKGLKVFVTYAHKNTAAKDKLITYLAVMKQNGLIRVWHDNEILPGNKWRDAIFNNLADSDILLYLTCAYSLASENCNKELAAKLNPKIRVIPIILEHCDWQNHQLSKFQALPNNGKPINEWQPRSKGWQNVVDGVRRTIEEMQTQEDSPSRATEEEWRAEAAFQLGNAFMMIGQISRAIEAYSLAIKLNPRDTDAYNNRGVAYQKLGKFDRAIEDYNTAIPINPYDAVIYSNRGAAYVDKGEFDRAINDLNRAIELNPNDATTYYNRGEAYRMKGEINRAIEDYTKAIQLNPHDPIAYNNRGAIYRSIGDYDGAIVDCDRAIELQPDYADSYSNRGTAYRNKGDYVRAIVDLDKAIQLKPGLVEAYNNRGNAYSDKGEYDRAIVDFNKVIELSSGLSIAYNNRGVAYYSKGEVDRALEDYNKAIDLKPIFVGVYYNRGEVWLRLREWEKAKADLTIAKEKGINIILEFRKEYESVENFESKHGVKLPEFIASMLTPRIIAARKKEGWEATDEVATDAEIALDEILRNYERAWKTLGERDI